jgi:hypothetical protein
MIPEWTEDGLLPIGVHDATWDELCKRYGTNSRRQTLLAGLADASVALAGAGCTRIWLDGSFVTTTDIPGDYDACWDWQGVDQQALDPVLLNYSPSGRATIKAKYLGDVLINVVEGSSGLAFVDFFQISRDGKPKGIVAFDPKEAL